MSDIMLANQELLAPQPRVGITIRPATLGDLPWMDALQKKHSKQLGYFPTKQFEGYIAMGGVLVAEAVASSQSSVVSESNQPTTDYRLLTTPLGYIISRDRYLKRDELGVIYQLCVSPGEQRKLVGAALLAAVFDRSAYGCRLYCCLCAQDLAANRFWEAMGFVPVAFRGGSDKKRRVHIFWQKRIRRGDVSTPWWFPSKTEGGALRADRLVLPIPRGMRWSDEMPVVVSDDPVGHAIACRPAKKRHAIACPTPAKKAPVQFGPPGAVMPVVETPTPAPVPVVREKCEKPKCDPKLLQAARELRDRWLEQVNADPMMLVAGGKYDVSKRLDARPHPNPLPEGEGTRQLLPAA